MKLIKTIIIATIIISLLMYGITKEKELTITRIELIECENTKEKIQQLNTPITHKETPQEEKDWKTTNKTQNQKN